ncbi:lipopolysaccharide kinase InaA family protein [Desulfosarcina ovata]|uniref:lipopolysaccharide kinase InaA family protein n=1 Tax=Desulfosarcina ovata TaxID=83564 RepID=UPI0012D2B3F3|nr:lipopolysaccharide kinase InaA family protein [Desulfosarcina ovata]
MLFLLPMDHINKRAIIIHGKKITTPFNLELNGSDALLECLELLRLVPGKRAVLLSRWHGKLVVAKLFLAFFKAGIYAKKEIAGKKMLDSANIATAEIVYSGSTIEGRIKVVIFEYIHPSKMLSDVLLSDQDSNRYHEYLKKLVKLIARFHEAGIIHSDLHLDNFLVKEKILYAIDGSSMKKGNMGFPLGTKKSLRNLAVIFAQLNIQDMALLKELVDIYFSVRFLKSKERSEIFLKKSIDKRRRIVSKGYLKKNYRESTETVCRKSFSSFVLCKRDHYTKSMESFLGNPDIAFDSPEMIMLKNGNSTTVVRLTVDGMDLVIKRYNAKNIFRGFRHAFKKSYADRSWGAAHYLINNGIKTARPIAMKEMRIGPFRGKSYLVCEYIDGINALDYFIDPAFKDKKIMAQKVVGIFNQLELLRVRHGDMKATNILIYYNNPYLIDLDSMVIYKNNVLSNRAHRKDVDRFMRNWSEHPKIKKMFSPLS